MPSSIAVRRVLHTPLDRLQWSSRQTSRGCGFATWSSLNHPVSNHTASSCVFLRPRRPTRLGLAHNDLTRTLSSSSGRPIVLTDPDRPDLFYHLLPPPTHISQTQPVFGLSFVDSLNSSSEFSAAESPRIMGYLPAAVSEGSGIQAGLNDFKENSRFREILHAAIQEGLKQGVDEVQSNGALQLHQGWMHIHDDRNIPPLGRIGDPDDIIATVLVENGKIVADTYQPMPAYRICTSDGVLKLTDGLAKKLKEVLLRQN